MVAQIIAKNTKVTVKYRFNNKDIYLKCLDKTYAMQMIAKIKSKGGSVQEARNWLKCDIIGDHKIVKLGPYEIDIDIDTDKQIEKKFFNFFLFTLKKAGFKCETEVQSE